MPWHSEPCHRHRCAVSHARETKCGGARGGYGVTDTDTGSDTTFTTSEPLAHSIGERQRGYGVRHNFHNLRASYSPDRRAPTFRVRAFAYRDTGSDTTFTTSEPLTHSIGERQRSGFELS